MKHILILAIVALALGGCAGLPAFLQNAADVEQEAVEIYGQIKAGYKVVAAVVDKQINAICAKLPEISDGARNAAAAVPNPGPKTQKFINDADDALDRATIACASYTGNGNPSTFFKLVAAYKAGRSAVIAANAAGGK